MTVTPIRRQSVTPEAPHDPVQRLVTAGFRLDFIPPDPAGVYSVRPCVVSGCDRIQHSEQTRLCALHKRAWEASNVDLEPWARTAPPKPSAGEGEAEDVRAASRGVFVLAPLRGRIRWEVAYGLQVRGTAVAPGRVKAHVINKLIERLVALRIDSLLEHEPAVLVQQLGIAKDAGSTVAFLRATQAALHGGLDLPGRRVLGLRRAGSGYFADYSAIEPAWLGPLVKRWTEYRLAVEKASPHWAGAQVAALAHFGLFLKELNLQGPHEITRAVVVDFLTVVNEHRQPNGKPLGPVTRSKWLGTVNTFLQDVRHHEWAAMPANARYLAGGLPRRPVPQPRFISEYVMQQMESEASLQRITRPDLRVAVRILMTTGTRTIHVLTLEYGCLEELPRSSGPSAWALRFLDTKTRKDMRVPIRQDVAHGIREQQARVTEEYGSGCALLFPRRRSGCVEHVTPQALHKALSNWCDELRLTDESGSRTRVTAHQFRHTCGTRWINNNVPQHVVKELLGHRTDAMVAVYARLHDSTVRREWEAFQRVGISGEAVAPPAGQVAEVEWMVEQVSRATQALPNGYCALPIQQSCPHANACLTCDSFTTGPEFLPILEQQRDHHGALLRTAEQLGHQRMAEINRVPFVNLENIIDGLRRLTPREAG